MTKKTLRRICSMGAFTGWVSINLTTQQAWGFSDPRFWCVFILIAVIMLLSWVEGVLDGTRETANRKGFHPDYLKWYAKNIKEK